MILKAFIAGDALWGDAFLSTLVVTWHRGGAKSVKRRVLRPVIFNDVNLVGNACVLIKVPLRGCHDAIFGKAGDLGAFQSALVPVQGAESHAHAVVVFLRHDRRQLGDRQFDSVQRVRETGKLHDVDDE